MDRTLQSLEARVPPSPIVEAGLLSPLEMSNSVTVFAPSVKWLHVTAASSECSQSSFGGGSLRINFGSHQATTAKQTVETLVTSSSAATGSISARAFAEQPPPCEHSYTHCSVTCTCDTDAFTRQGRTNLLENAAARFDR